MITAAKAGRFDVMKILILQWSIEVDIDEFKLFVEKMLTFDLWMSAVSLLQ